MELRVYGRAEEQSRTQEGAVIVYKPILIFKLFGISIGKTSINWTTKGAKVFRRRAKASRVMKSTMFLKPSETGETCDDASRSGCHKGAKVFRSRLENGEAQDVAWNCWASPVNKSSFWEDDFPRSWPCKSMEVIRKGPSSEIRRSARRVANPLHFSSWLAGWISEQSFRLVCYA